jgi:DNA topoisomerase VI subunit B
MLRSYFLSHSAQVFEGHPFIVEAGVSLGGKDVIQDGKINFRITIEGSSSFVH